MQLIKNTQRLFSRDLLLKSYFATQANPLATQLGQNKLRNAIRFENQNRTWTYEELEQHSNAFAYGLVEMGYKQGDKLLVWVEKSNTAEVVGAQIGASKAGVALVPTYAQNQAELEEAIKSSDCTGILYSPNSAIGENQQYSNVILASIPELEQNGNRGAVLKSKKFPKLKFVSHTGFYSKPGQYKYKDTLVYASKNFNSLSLPQSNGSTPLIIANNKSYSLNDLTKQAESLRKAHNITEKQTVIVSGDAKSPLSFALGVLSSTLYGNYSIYTGNMDMKQLGKLIKLHSDTFLVVDSDLVQSIQNLEWDEAAKQTIKSVALFDKGNAKNVNAEGLFAGKGAKVYGQTL